MTIKPVTPQLIVGYGRFQQKTKENAMNIALLVLWALVGWCGTPWPRRWPWPPPPPPDPWFTKIVNVVGGVVGGWLYYQIWAAPEMTSIGAAATALGAIVGSIVFGDVYGLVRRQQKG